MKRGGQVLGYAECLSNASSKVGGKMRVSIADDFSGETEPLEHMFQVELGYSSASDCGRTRKEYCPS